MQPFLTLFLPNPPPPPHLSLSPLHDRGIDIAGNTVGIAFVSTMCDSLRSVGLSQDRRSGVDSVGSTAAHELGHIFNMAHDDGQSEHEHDYV